MLGVVLAAVGAALLVIEYLRGMQTLRSRPKLPADDQPPRALGMIIAADIPAEVSRGMARLITELRHAARQES